MHAEVPHPSFSDRIIAQFRPEKAWTGTRALVPVETCYRILDFTIWLACPPLVLAILLLVASVQSLQTSSIVLWVLAGLLLPLVLASACRAWPFTLRFFLVAIPLFLGSTLVSALAAITPNWTLQISLLVALTTLFYGCRAGLGAILLMVASHGVVAWGWVNGSLPGLLVDSPIQSEYMNFTQPLVWLRVLGVSASLLTILVINSRTLFKGLKQNEIFKQDILDSMSAHIAVLNSEGTIILVNAPWLAFARQNANPKIQTNPRTGVGVNYLEVCRNCTGDKTPEAILAQNGILDVLEGRRTRFTMEYRCDAPGQPRWFSMTVTPMGGWRTHVVVSHVDISERCQAERSLHKQQALLREMGCVAQVGGWEFDPATELGFWTDELYKIHDVPTQGPITSQMLLNLYLPESKQRIQTAIQAALEHSTPIDLELELVTTKGVHKWVHSIGHPVLENGKVVRVQGSLQDITNLKATKAALQASGEEFRTMFELASIGIAQVNANNGHFLRVNQRMSQITGYSIEELLNLSFADITHPADKEKDLSIYQRARDGGEASYYLEKRYIGKAGNVIWANLNVAIIRDSQGKPYLAVSTVEDITSKKQTEASLEEYRAILDAAMASMTDAVFISDKNGYFINFNEAFTSFHRLPNKDTCARTLAEYKGLFELTSDKGEQVPMDMWPVPRALRGESASNVEYTLRRTDTAETWIGSYSFSPIRGALGEIVGTVGVARDITIRRRSDAQALRTQRLEAIGTLSSGIAHDLNNILAPMLMASGILKDSLKEQRDRELMELIERAARRGAEIIRQLLTFSRGIEGQRVSVQLRHLIKEMAGIARETFPRNITVIESTERDVWPITADATQIHQVLMNLCVNARDAMPDGGELRISAKNIMLTEKEIEPDSALQPGPKVLLSVTDTGIGIPKDIIEKIFDPFFTTKELGKGTGLGLSTVLGIIRSHGGAINVESEPKRGTCFKVYLHATPTAPKEEPTEGIHDGLRGRGETILIVDDEEPILKAVNMALSGMGYRVLCARNGQEALQIFVEHQQEVKLVFTDVMMPVMDGLKLARVLHDLDEHILVVAASGLDPDERKAELAAGYIVDFLNKPAEIETLLRTLHKHLNPTTP